jgi:VCBS repeat-containing protein
MSTKSTSYLNTPQAADDSFEITDLAGSDGLNLGAGVTQTGGVLYFDVMANDQGGNAKQLWDAVVGDEASVVKDPTKVADLLSRDTAAETQPTTASGSAISIVNGKIAYTMAPSLQAAIDALPAGGVITETITYSIRLANGTFSFATMTLTFRGTNDQASISGTNSGTVIEDGTQSTSGKLTVTDIDTGEARFQVATGLVTDWGTFTFDENTGEWTFTIDNAAAQQLGAGVEKTATLMVTSADGTATETITVKIVGVNDAAIITGDLTGDVTEDSPASASGTVTVADVDADESAFQTVDAADLETAYGDFTFDETSGAWTFAIDNAADAVQALGAGKTADAELTVSSTDGTTQTITVTVTGVNDAATFGGDIGGTLSEDEASISGTFTTQDVDAGEQQFSPATPPTVTTEYGTFNFVSFTASTAGWTFTPNEKAQELRAGQSVTQTMTVKTLDGTEQTITVLLQGANDAATIGGQTTITMGEDDRSIVNNTLVTSGQVFVQDADQDQSIFQTPASLQGTYGTFTFNPQTGFWGYILNNDSVQFLNAGQTATDTLTVRSLDGTAMQDLVVTITGANEAPVVSTTPTEGNDSLIGTPGGDTINGLGGDDTISGGDGRDSLLGGSGNDVLNGGEGRDTLTGGAGDDTLSGGGAADVFVFTSIGDGLDVIIDFSNSPQDIIDLSAIDADVNLAGFQALSFNGTTAAANKVWYTAGTNQVTVSIDVNGDAVSDLNIIAQGVTSLSANSFDFI